MTNVKRQTPNEQAPHSGHLSFGICRLPFMISAMDSIWVKIEGLTRPADAAKVADLGADAIGLVFAESPRRVTIPQAKAIVDALPPFTESVALFVNSEVAEINRVVEAVRPTHVQLHGDEPPEIIRWIDARCIKAFRIRSADWVDEVQAWLDGLLDINDVAAVVLDAYDANKAGGTGKRFNWQWVIDARNAGKLDGWPPIILAGGLTADCVAGAINAVRPWGVDVSSGVERAPAVKDFGKIKRFIDATDSTKFTPGRAALLRWIRNGRRGRMLNYLDAHPQLKAEWPWGPSVLGRALESERRYALVPMLLDHGVSVNQREGADWTPIMTPAATHDMRMLRLLLDRGADVNACDSGAGTAFSSACFCGALDAAKLLHARGAEINRPDTRGRTPLDLAKFLAPKEVYEWMRSIHCVHRVEPPGWAGRRI